MIKVTIGNNLERTSHLVDENSTLRAALEKAGIDVSRGMITMDGVSLKAGELNKTFADFGLDGSEGKNKCYLLSVVKADNAI